ncbi:hypothetical protein AB9X29_003777 [Vibrio vulnificus]
MKKIKSDSASRVLQLMDSYADGQDRYKELLVQVAREDNVPVEQLEKELDEYI